MDDMNIKALAAEMRLFLKQSGIKYYGYSLTAKETQEVVNSLEKLDKIQQIVNKWNNDASHSFSDMCKINEILEE